MLSFVELNLDNLDELREDIMASEKLFAEPIMSTIDDYWDILASDTPIAFVALLDNKYIGNIIGCRLEGVDYEEICGEISGKKYAGKNIVYLYSFVIDLEHQNKGYGLRLLEEFMNAAKAKGFDTLMAHFRKATSIKFANKFGAEELKEYDNWEGTGEDYVLCSIPLR